MECVFVCLCVPPLRDKGPNTGPKAPKLGQRPSLGVFGPHTDRDYAGSRPAFIELIINLN